MTESFPKVEKSERGYDPVQVEKFLTTARDAFSRLNEGIAELTADDIRTAAFSLVKGGYEIVAVDEALERVERVFYQKEREKKITVLGQAGWQEWIDQQRTEIVTRLQKPEGKKFKRAGFLRQGYSRSGVDAFAQVMLEYFEEGKPLTADQVRKIAFVQQSNGYHETQVDAVLDRVIDLLLDVEFEAEAR